MAQTLDSIVCNKTSSIIRTDSMGRGTELILGDVATVQRCTDVATAKAIALCPLSDKVRYGRETMILARTTVISNGGVIRAMDLENRDEGTPGTARDRNSSGIAADIACALIGSRRAAHKGSKLVRGGRVASELIQSKTAAVGLTRRIDSGFVDAEFIFETLHQLEDKRYVVIVCRVWISLPYLIDTVWIDDEHVGVEQFI